MRFRAFWIGLVAVAVLASGYVVIRHALPEDVGAGGTSMDAVLARGHPGPDSELCEVDQDKAAGRYAIARALKTDLDIARRDVAPLALLHEVRAALNAWEAEIFSTGSVLTHGGTLWSHAGNRAPADVEDFLATLAPRFPAEADMDRYLSLKQLPETAAVLAHIDAIPPIGPDGFSTPAELAERNRDLAGQKRKLREAWVALDRALLMLPPDLASAIANRATRNLRLLDEER